MSWEIPREVAEAMVRTGVDPLHGEGAKKWAKIRRKVLERAANHCEKCHEEDFHLEVHHLTYERFGDELLEDLEALCFRCHGKVSAAKRTARHKAEMPEWYLKSRARGRVF